MIDLFHVLEDSGLKAALISKGLIHEDQWALIAEQVDRGHGGVLAGLVRADIISEADCVQFLSDLLDLHVEEIDEVEIAVEVKNCLPADFVQQHQVIPYRLDSGVLHVAVGSSLTPAMVEDMRLLSGHEVEMALALPSVILKKIAEIYQVTVEKMLENLHSGSDASAENRNLHDIEVMANEPTVINLVNVILSTAMKERVSDVHLTPFEEKLELRYRIDGILSEQSPPPKRLHAAIVSRIKIMADMDIAERYLPQDGHIQIHHRGVRVDIRVGTMPTIYGESVVMRLLEKSSKVATLEELGMDAKRAQLLERIVSKTHGIFLATGPTGSGKTTTLYSVLSKIFTVEKKIITIEDPVEYELPGVAQIPVRPSRDFTFAKGLRAILRQDPDIVMVGEIRDSETAEIAIRAALTGHLVFSTLHTNDSVGAVSRLIDMGVEPFLIASSLEGVLAQRLVRKICESCKTEMQPDNSLVERMSSFGVQVQGKTFYYGKGCEACRGLGYRGRVGLYELLKVTEPLREMIVQRKSNTEIKALLKSEMVTIQQDALLKVTAGETSLEEALRVAFGDAS